MEDAHCHWYDANSDTALFGVFDGHGGKGVSLWVAERLPKLLEQNARFKSGDYAQALHECFMLLDCEMRDNPSVQERIIALQSQVDADEL